MEYWCIALVFAIIGIAMTLYRKKHPIHYDDNE